MHSLGRALVALAVWGSPGEAARPDQRWQVLSHRADFQGCNIGVVTGRRFGARLRVTAAPTAPARSVGWVAPGEFVYACNEHGEDHGRWRAWYGIVYSRPGAGCRSVLHRRAPLRYTRSCRQGWVDRTRVELLTG
jgi:hypothetical protein